jgi:pyridoxamine 5'-phosphate oxidase
MTGCVIAAAGTRKLDFRDDFGILNFAYALEISVRVEGTVSSVSDAEADQYFASRPRGSQIGAWASLQSRPMDRPDDLDRRVAEFDAKLAAGPVPRPPHWSGFRLVPARIEFWRRMPNRLHERHCYVRGGAEWRLGVLYP